MLPRELLFELLNPSFLSNYLLPGLLDVLYRCVPLLLEVVLAPIDAFTAVFRGLNVGGIAHQLGVEHMAQVSRTYFALAWGVGNDIPLPDVSPSIRVPSGTLRVVLLRGTTVPHRVVFVFSRGLAHGVNFDEV